MKKNTVELSEIPEGYVETTSGAAFAVRNGPYYEKVIDESRIIRAFRPDERHMNGLNFVHGGMLMSFADSSLARAINHKHNQRCVTVKMNSEFLLPVRGGDWVEAHMEVVRNTKSVVFVRGELKVGNKVVFKADAIFHHVKDEKKRMSPK
ncbi:MAG: PaaI family thioesterase [Sneathiella sp.]|nr:PaaI family thioesterase [Sneathiella sp.]